MRFSRRRQIRAIAIFLVTVGLLWRQVFVMTGILWWQAPQAANRPAPPPAAHFREASTNWIDLPAYQKANPVWPLDRP
jgi:hypothetical protein